MPFLCLMKTKACPACAMQVDKEEEICPICQYEFPVQNTAYRWLLMAIAIILLLFFLF